MGAEHRTPNTEHRTPCVGDLPLEYLRFLDDGTPAAGTFPGWPERAAELRVLDPCCGSGHFLVAAFELLRRFRMIEEGLDAAAAGDAVLRDNLFGLEIDPRCTQLAAFNLALAAWKAGGYRPLPLPNVACSGLPVGDRLYEWTALAEGDPDLEAALRRLYHLFRDAPDLGSLIDPARAAAEDGMFAPDWAKVAPLLEQALAKERPGDDPAAAVFGAAAQGAARAADLLSGRYHLVTTNVPYLKRANQTGLLRGYLERVYEDAKPDLATAFVCRCFEYCCVGGVTALVAPQNWRFLGFYSRMRERLLKSKLFAILGILGPGAFETISGHVVNVALWILRNSSPTRESTICGFDATFAVIPGEKAHHACLGPLLSVLQRAQLKNPDSRIVLEEMLGSDLLGLYGSCYAGINSGDYPRFGRAFWEMSLPRPGWELQQTTVRVTDTYGGLTQAFRWDNGGGAFAQHIASLQGRLGGSWRRGGEAWGKMGVAVSSMGDLSVSLYAGDLFDNNTAVMVPRDPAHLPAIWAFCSSPEFNTAVRRIDQKLNVTNATLVKVPFDLAHWQKVAAERYPNGLPEPDSDDPTQWLFHGDLTRSTDPLQVAVARLLGYRWPRQQGMTVSGAPPVASDGLERFADADGIVCLPPVRGEPPAAARLRALLAAAYGAAWSVEVLDRLLADAGFAGRGLEEWLRDGFFAQHCRRFHNRPFIWHVWDGRKDGFSALVNYHKLARARLERLTYPALGDWIAAQREADRRGEAGAGGRLAAALVLQENPKAILHGEPPYDIFVRWKPLAQQPLGWEPDLNDGVRLNIRPFVEAGILRAKFTIHWKKDRGLNADGSERENNLHFTRAEKEAAQKGC